MPKASVFICSLSRAVFILHSNAPHFSQGTECKCLSISLYPMNSGIWEQISALEGMFMVDSIQGSVPTNQWPSAFQQARAIISELDESPNFPSSLGTPRWISLTGMLQMVAYLDPDNGGERDIAAWCERQWATILQDHPQSVPALQGMIRPCPAILS